MKKIFSIKNEISLNGSGKSVCTVYTKGSNFKSPFETESLKAFDNAANTKGREADTDELYEYLAQRQKTVDIVAFKGGEPTIHNNILDVMRHIKGFYGMEIGLETNGTEPDMLFEIICEGIAEYVTLDILSGRTSYSLASGISVDDEIWKKLEESKIMLIEEDEVEREFCTTVVGGFHTDRDFEEIRDFIDGGDTYRLRRFIGGQASGTFYTPSDDEMQKYAEIVRPAVKNVIAEPCISLF